MKQITEELLERFINRETNLEETMAVIDAMKKDKELMERYIAVLRFDAMIAEDEAPSIPMEKMAAKSEDNLCDIICERFILKSRLPKSYTLLGEAKDEQTFLNEAKNLTDEGVALYNVGRILEGYGLSVTRQFDASLQTLTELLVKGESLIVVVNEETLSGKDGNNGEPNHAVCVLQIKDDSVILYNPQDDEGIEEKYPTSIFEKAWASSNNYVVAVGDIGTKVYEPHPINLDEIDLNPDIEDLIEPIAENLHDIWAQSRMDEGYRYGPENNSDPDKGPLTNKDLRPYSELPDSEKEYDRKMAIGTLKLAARLGFKIVKVNPEDGYVCPDCGKRIELEMSYCPHCGRELELGDFVI